MAIIQYSSFPLLLAWLTSLTAAMDGAVASESINSKETEQPKVIVTVGVDLNPEAVDVEVDHNGEKTNCQKWVAELQCEQNPVYMQRSCARSCAVDTKVEVYDGEDVGIAAFRFAEEHASHFTSHAAARNGIMIVARLLQKQLETTDYEPPKELTHCGKRQCSAGKLWKRAAELRKADMHDDAGADLIRVLLKTGIEVDFIERCERNLEWALESLHRQREREKREAIEEAKVEARMAEERAAMEEALERKKEYEAALLKFGIGLQQSISEADGSAKESASVGADGSVENDRETEEKILSVKQTFVRDGPQGGNCGEVLQLLRKVRPSEKTTDVLLIEARCHEMLGEHKSASSAASRLIQKAASYTPWVNDSPRMIAVTLGANAAMQLGLSESAISFYQSVLKFDPEQEKTRKQYLGLKKVVKLMRKADAEIEKGYNRKAAVFVEDCLSAMRGLDVDSPLFRSKIQLKQCTILSSMGKYEEALSHCDPAVEQRAGNESVSPESKKEAYIVRSEALLEDMDYDEAVQDMREAFELIPDDQDHRMEKRQLQQKLQQTMRQRDMWNGGQKDGRYNDHTGFPDGRPPQRDHQKILQLPIDLDQHSKEIRCAWLKKQFKALVRKYHPDKYKGNKKRAARKFKEVKEAKEIISKQWQC
mmetsp:Transcript_79688/g.161443  ORF Transcript_79688/g.161443 Transcript_79688/m.161443 type:complete len:651 (-) Transcript_79688:223-2175(-)